MCKCNRQNFKSSSKICDAQLKAAQIQIEKARVENQAKSEGVRIGLKAEQDRKNLESQQTLESIRLGADAQNKQDDLRERIAARVANIHKGK